MADRGTNCSPDLFATDRPTDGDPDKPDTQPNSCSVPNTEPNIELVGQEELVEADLIRGFVFVCWMGSMLGLLLVVH